MQGIQPMRHKVVALLLASPLLWLPGCNKNNAENSAANLTGTPGRAKPSAGAMTIDPQKIVSEAGSIRTLHGVFSIRAAKPNEPALDPATVGGACLLAKIPVEGKSCSSQEECNIPVPGQPDGWYGYCLGRDQVPTTLGGTCWVKLSDEQNCLKGVGAGNYSTPTMDVSAAYTYVAQHSPNWHKPIDWVLMGCLNGQFTGAPPCATGNGPHIYAASPTRPVP
jgi:hypothetical protein